MMDSKRTLHPGQAHAAHPRVAEPREALPGGTAPDDDALPVHRGQIVAVRRPLHEGLRPRRALVHLLGLAQPEGIYHTLPCHSHSSSDTANLRWRTLDTTQQNVEPYISKELVQVTDVKTEPRQICITWRLSVVLVLKFDVHTICCVTLRDTPADQLMQKASLVCVPDSSRRRSSRSPSGRGTGSRTGLGRACRASTPAGSPARATAHIRLSVRSKQMPLQALCVQVASRTRAPTLLLPVSQSLLSREPHRGRFRHAQCTKPGTDGPCTTRSIVSDRVFGYALRDNSLITTPNDLYSTGRSAGTPHVRSTRSGDPLSTGRLAPGTCIVDESWRHTVGWYGFASGSWYSSGTRAYRSKSSNSVTANVWLLSSL